MNVLDMITRALEDAERSAESRRNAVLNIIALQRAHNDASDRKTVPPQPTLQTLRPNLVTPETKSPTMPLSSTNKTPLLLG